MPRVPDRGDIYHIDLDPTKGKEQRGGRYVYVLSPAAHNRRGLVVVLPVSQGVTLARSTGFAASLSGAGLNAQGVVICDQPRTVDLQARDGRYLESAPAYVTTDVLTRIAALVT
ncbi:MAG: type II toxin-antitoxin system PemK/MazF family toxin [Burkholderiales bacterium]